MPIIATRDGAVIASTPITPEQRERLWSAVFRNFIEKHPEVLVENNKDVRNYGTVYAGRAGGASAGG